MNIFSKLFAFLKKALPMAQPPIFTGALKDDRSMDIQNQDIHFSEIVGTANVVNWTDKYPNTIRKFPDVNQGQTGMCGAFSLSKSLGIMFQQKYGTFIEFFQPDIYQRRANRPTQGMAMYDMMNIAGQGVTLKQFFNASYKNDDEADAIQIEQWQRDVGRVFSVVGSVRLPNDIEMIASVIQTTGKAPIELSFFNSSEWSREIPQIIDQTLTVDSFKAIRHFTVYSDFTLYQGKKYIVVEDSAWFGGINRRLISEEWINRRVTEVRYPMNFKFQVGAGNKPTYDGLTIMSAQQCLRYEGFFPTNIAFVENVGSFTRKALQFFQEKYGLPQTQALDMATKNKLLQLYP